MFLILRRRERIKMTWKKKTCGIVSGWKWPVKRESERKGKCFEENESELM